MPDAPLNVLVITADYPPIEGGISTVAVHVTRELASMGHHVTVIAPRLPDAETFDAGESATIIRVRGYAMSWLRFVPMFFAALPRLKSTDLIVGINAPYGGLIGLYAKTFYKKPYITFAYGYELLKFDSKSIFARLLRIVFRRARLVVAISRFTKNTLARITRDDTNVKVIYPGAPSAQIVPNEAVQKVIHRLVLEDRRIILAVGRLIARKGHAALVRALPRVLEKVPNACLVIVGRGPTVSACSRAAQDLGVRDHVRLPGHLPDATIHALYQVCDVFALPTGEGAGGHVEGFGLVFSEAHAYGKPVIAGRSGGVPEAVLDGETGLLVDPGDDDGLAEALIRVLTDPSLAQRFGEAGKHRVETELNWTVFTRRMMDAFEAQQ